MTVSVTHTTVATGTDDGSKQVSKDAWNETHTITGGPQYATVTVSSAQLLDLHNTPVTLVEAPGAGKFIAVTNVVAYLSYGTVDYVETGGDIAFVYDGEPGDPVFTTNPQRSADHIEYGTSYLSVSLPASSMVNVPIVATVNAAITDGDGTLTIEVEYRIVDVP